MSSQRSVAMKNSTFIIFLLICIALPTAAIDTWQSYNSDKNTIVQEAKPPAEKTSNPTDNGKLSTPIKWNIVFKDAKSEAIPADYEIIMQTYTDRNIVIDYPQIKGMNDHVIKQALINEVIKSEALEVLRQYADSDIEKLTMKQNYEIKWQSAKLLSIKYLGYVNCKGAVHPYEYCYTTNIAMVGGRSIKLNDVVVADDNFIEKVKKGKLSLPVTIEKALDMRFFHGNVRSAPCYFTADALVLCFGVGANGVNMDIEMKYRDIADNINVSSQGWEDFIKSIK